MTDDELEGTPAVRLLRDFVNAREPQVGTDDLAEPAALGAWFDGKAEVPDRVPGRVAGGVAGGVSGGVRISAHHLQQAIDVREGLRAVFSGHAGHDADLRAVGRLNEVLVELPVGLQLDGDGYVLVPATNHPLAGALAMVADAIRQCHEDGTWPRLKVCARDTCRWAFYDASRNKVRRWCSMAGCGNHVKMKRAYARRTQQD